MGKKRIVKKGSQAGSGAASPDGTRATKLSRKHLERGILTIQATFNNTKLSLADTSGNVVAWGSSGNMGFKGARKGTPFAAAKVGEVLGDKAKLLGMKEVIVHVRGVGSGRESSIRSFISKAGAVISHIEDQTPIPFNGPKAPRARRV